MCLVLEPIRHGPFSVYDPDGWSLAPATSPTRGTERRSEPAEQTEADTEGERTHPGQC